MTDVDYALIDSNGNVTSVIRITNNMIESFVPQEGLTPVAVTDVAITTGWTYVDGKFVAPPPPPPPPPSPIISKAVFWGRFTPDEHIAIVSGAQSNVTLAVWLQTAMVQDHINLLDPVTKTGMDVLVKAGVLTSDREILILTP